jgi:PhnB protein
MTAPKIYLTFPGTARDALGFYADVFGAELTLHTFGDFQRTDGPADHIAHGVLKGPVSIYGSDAADGTEGFRMDGVMLTLLGSAEPAVLHRWFDRLADGGRIVDQLGPKPWGASDGQVVDRHGVHWLIGYEPES